MELVPILTIADMISIFSLFIFGRKSDVAAGFFSFMTMVLTVLLIALHS